MRFFLISSKNLTLPANVHTVHIRFAWAGKVMHSFPDWRISTSSAIYIQYVTTLQTG